MWQSDIAGRVGLTRATVNCILWRQAVTGTLVPGKSTGTLEDHTSWRPCFVEDGPTGSLHKCSGLDGMDEEFLWNECWPENHQQATLSHGYVLIDPQESPFSQWCEIIICVPPQIQWAPQRHFAKHHSAFLSCSRNSGIATANQIITPHVNGLAWSNRVW